MQGTQKVKVSFYFSEHANDSDFKKILPSIREKNSPVYAMENNAINSEDRLKFLQELKNIYEFSLKRNIDPNDLKTLSIIENCFRETFSDTHNPKFMAAQATYAIANKVRLYSFEEVPAKLDIKNLYSTFDSLKQDLHRVFSHAAAMLSAQKTTFLSMLKTLSNVSTLIEARHNGIIKNIGTASLDIALVNK